MLGPRFALTRLIRSYLGVAIGQYVAATCELTWSGYSAPVQFVIAFRTSTTAASSEWCRASVEEAAL